MRELINPKSVAIIGASVKKKKIGGILLDNLIELKYRGKVYPINPKYTKIGKYKCYKTVLDIDKKVDLAVLAVSAVVVPGVIEECQMRKKPIKNFVIISAGFSESNREGRKREEKIKKLAREHDLNIVGPNCLGIVNASKKINLSFAPNTFQKGNMGFVTQSGAITSALFDLSKQAGIGFSSMVSLGNKAVMDELDFLEYFEGDKETKVVGFYLESIKKGREFAERIKRCKKPVVILKSGNSEEAKKAIQSHTGAMAGEMEVTKTALEDAGAIFVDEIDKFIEVAKILSHYKMPQNQKVAIVTNAGGPGVITTDLIAKNANLELFHFSHNKQKKLTQGLPVEASVKNPIDLLGDASAEMYYQTIKKVLKNDKVGSVIAIITKQSNTDVEMILKVIRMINKSSRVPIFPVLIGQSTEKNKVSIFEYPSALTDALGQIVEQGRRKKFVKIKTCEYKLNKVRHVKVEKKIKRAKVLSYQMGYEIASLYGLNCLKAVEARKVKVTKINYPQILKIDSSSILHKSVKGGVIKNIRNASEFKTAVKSLKSLFKGASIISQKQVESGFELIMGIKRDSSFGPVVLVGVGGIFVEIMDLKVMFTLPIEDKLIQYKLEQVGLKKIFDKQKINIKEVIENVKKLGMIAMENPEIKELDINPIIFYPNRKAVVVDIKVLVFDN